MEALEAALNTLYTNPDNEAKKRANEYLSSYQKSAAAWDTTHSLLSSSTTSSYAIFFAAQTLHHKIQYDFHELPSSAHEPLRDAVLTHLKNYASNTVVRTQLCIALVSLAIQVPTWTSIPHSLMTLLSSHTEPVLIQVLTLLPEELDYYQGYEQDSSSSSSNTFERDLQASAPVVLAGLVTVMQQSSPEVLKMIYKCLTSWIRYVPNLCASDVASNAAVLSVFDILVSSESDIFEEAVDLLVAVFRTFEDGFAAPVIVTTFVPRVMALKQHFFEQHQRNEEDVLVGYCRVFSEMAESYVPLIIGDEDINQGVILELLLACLSVPVTEVSVITLRFWDRYTRLLVQKETVGSKHIPYVRSLASTCVQKLEFPTDFGSWPEDLQGDFKRNRVDIGTILQDCCILLGVSNVVENCMSVLVQSSSWKSIEAALYTLRSVAKQVVSSSTSNTSNFYSQLLTVLTTVNSSHPAVLYTTNLVINRYSKAISNESSALVLQALSIVTASINVTELTVEYRQWQVPSSAATALRSIFTDNPTTLHEAAMSFYHSDGLRNTSNILSARDQGLIVEGICATVSVIQNEDERVSRVTEMIRPVMVMLQSNTSTNVVALERLVVIIDHIKVSNKSFYVALLSELLPMLVVPKDNDTTAENICRLIKKLIRSIKPIELIMSVLPNLVEFITMSFRNTFQSPLLYLGGVVVCDLKQQQSATSLLSAMVRHLSQDFLSKINNSLSSMVANPDATTEFFYMIERCDPNIILSPDLVLSVMQNAATGIPIQHSGANKSILTCMEALLLNSTVRHSNENLQSIVYNSINAIVTVGIPRHKLMREKASVSAVLLLVAQQLGNVFQQSVTKSLQSFPEEVLSSGIKNSFMASLSTATDEQSFRKALRVLSNR